MGNDPLYARPIYLVAEDRKMKVKTPDQVIENVPEPASVLEPVPEPASLPMENIPSEEHIQDSA